MRKWIALILLLLVLHAGAQERIVTLSPALSEMVHAVGAGASIVGESAHSADAAKRPKREIVGDYFGVSLEKIMALHPTLVLLQRNNIGLLPKLKRLGIEAHLIRLGSLEDIRTAFLTIGKLLGADATARAQEMVAHIDADLKSLKGIVQDKKILIVFGRYERLDKAIYAAGSDLWFADIVKVSGNRNALQGHFAKQPVLSWEDLLSIDPDIIYILAHGKRPTPAQRQKLKKPWLALPVKAGKRGLVYLDFDPEATVPGVGVRTFIAHFREVLEDARRRSEAF